MQGTAAFESGAVLFRRLELAYLCLLGAFLSLMLIGVLRPSLSRTALESFGLRGSLIRPASNHNLLTEQFIASKIKKINPDIDAAKIAKAIVLESVRANIDPISVASIVSAESTFNHKARSKRGAIGLMQLLPETAQYISKKVGEPWRGEAMLENPTYNIRLGVAYIKYLQDHFKGNLSLALSAYNWGPANVNKAIKDRSLFLPPAAKYAEKVLKTSFRWKTELRLDFA